MKDVVTDRMAILDEIAFQLSKLKNLSVEEGTFDEDEEYTYSYISLNVSKDEVPYIKIKCKWVRVC